MKIRSENSPRKPQVAETGIVGLKLRLDEFIAVEIHECDLALRELIAKSSLMDQEVRVSLMARAFADHYGCGIEPKESFRGGAYELCISVYRLFGNEFNDVGLQQNGFSADVQIEKSDSPIYEIVEFVRSIYVQLSDLRAF